MLWLGWVFIAVVGATAAALPVRLRTSLSVEPNATTNTGPIPVVLIADGRSGSTITLAVLATLTGSCPAPGMTGAHWDLEDRCWRELFGASTKEELAVENPKVLVSDYLSRATRLHANSTLVGFQWKTMKKGYLKTRTPEYKAAWQYLGENRVRALRYTRNPLDVYLSGAKHTVQTNLASHCAPDDQGCLTAMLAPFMVDVEALMEDLPNYDLAQRALLDDINASNVEYLNCSYEELISNGNASSKLWHWQRVLDFLGVRSTITMQELDEAFAIFTATHPDSQGANVLNWKDVLDALQKKEGGRYAHLIHR